MGFKKYERRPTFLDMELSKVTGQSRTRRFLIEVDAAIDWKPIEELITSQYPVGHSIYGNRAYPPVMLLKALLIQKWFGIASDPELENQINDRFSFKTFIGLPLSDSSPDHSVLSRFRTRIGKGTLEAVHHDLLLQFQGKGFSIESGMAVDARLVRSASRPLGKDTLRKRKEEKGRSTKARFQRDLESDWTVRKDEPVFGMKEHAAIDVESGLVLSGHLSRASEHDTSYFPYVLTRGIHGKDVPEQVYADKGYCSEANRNFLNLNGMTDGIMRKGRVNASFTKHEIERNKGISRVRYVIEQYFGLTAKYQGAGRARFTTLLKEGWNRLCQIMAFNIKRVILSDRRREVVRAM